MRKRYVLSQAELDELYAACRPVPYIVVGGYAPRSPQENANDAWCALGKKLGFDGMTVQPTGEGDRYFTADVLVEFSQDGDQRCAVRPGFRNLQLDEAGFGATDAEALADLELREKAAAHMGEGI